MVRYELIDKLSLSEDLTLFGVMGISISNERCLLL